MGLNYNSMSDAPSLGERLCVCMCFEGVTKGDRTHCAE